MALPGNWRVEDILRLKQVKGFNNELIIKSVESFSDIYTLGLSLENNLNGNELFKELVESRQEQIIQDINKQIEICHKNNYKIITYWDNEYPVLLKEINHPPVLLFIKGYFDNSCDIISVVGTRTNTLYGRLAAENYTEAFSQYGIIVCSGLANGIDTISHNHTMKCGGKTYAVIASGLDKISPMEAQKTAKKIIESGGCVITEYKCGMRAMTGFFPQRNRIISGIARATLVIESGLKGGALITAKFAFDQGRNVYAVPGKIFDKKSQGTNDLIKKNIAAPTLSPQDILDELGYTKLNFSIDENKKAKVLSEREKIIFNILDNEPKHIDEIAEATNLGMSELLVLILEMEFSGLIRQLPGKHYIRST